MKSLLAVAILVGAIGCGKSDNKAGNGAPGTTSGAPAATGGGGDQCIVGTYSKMDGQTKRSIVFKPDGTGTEIYEAGKDERPIKWTIKDKNTVHLSYIPHGDSVGGEFDMTYNCENKTFAVLYKKE